MKQESNDKAQPMGKQVPRRAPNPPTSPIGPGKGYPTGRKG